MRGMHLSGRDSGSVLTRWVHAHVMCEHGDCSRPWQGSIAPAYSSKLGGGFARPTKRLAILRDPLSQLSSDTYRAKEQQTANTRGAVSPKQTLCVGMRALPAIECNGEATNQEGVAGGQKERAKPQARTLRFPMGTMRDVLDLVRVWRSDFTPGEIAR